MIGMIGVPLLIANHIVDVTNVVMKRLEQLAQCLLV